VAVPVTGCLHLKTGATALPDGTVVAVTGWLDTGAFTDAGLRVVEAPETAGADLLLSGDRGRGLGGRTFHGSARPVARVRCVPGAHR
jgi:hypothetical protein